MKHQEKTHQIIGCAIRVHSELGCGFQEVIYQRSLEIEFRRAGFPSTHAQKAATTMLSKNIRRLPVLEQGKLIGTISRAMVAWAVLAYVRIS
jgi:GxxExxY protein